MPDLRFLKDEPIPLQKPMTIPTTNDMETTEPTIADVLRLLEEAYAPSREWSFSEAQHRILNKVMDALGKQEDGYYVVDDKEFAIIVTLVQNVAPKLTLMQGGKQSNAMSRNSPSIVDWLNAAPRERPKPVQGAAGESSGNGVVKEATKVAQEA